MKEAVTKMKAELGDDAVILHTKKYKEGGILGYGSKEMVEVTAAIEDEKPAVKPAEPEPAQLPTISVNPPSVLSQYKTNGTAEGLALAEKESSPRSPLSDESDKTVDTQSNKKPALTQPSLNHEIQNQASPLKAAMISELKSTEPLSNSSTKMPYEMESAKESVEDNAEQTETVDETDSEEQNTSNQQDKTVDLNKTETNNTLTNADETQSTEVQIKSTPSYNNVTEQSQNAELAQNQENINEAQQQPIPLQQQSRSSSISIRTAGTIQFCSNGKCTCNV